MLIALLATAAPPKKSAAVNEKSPAERLKENPDDADAFNAYMAAQLARIAPIVESKPDDAEKAIEQMAEFIGSLKPTSNLAKRFVTRAELVISGWNERLELARISLEVLAKQLRDNPNDRKAATMYISKIAMEVRPLALAKPEKADRIVSDAKRLIAELSDKIKKPATKRILSIDNRSLVQLERRIATGRQLAALIGTGASELGDIDAWVNGSPLTDDDLKGKVVMLDFWAVWNEPCIGTFPRLREWSERYEDKGLVLIGVTQYYNYSWDDSTGRAARSRTKVTPKNEHAMLEKFAQHHKLAHRFAVQRNGALIENYSVTGIPHVVVIDQKGKVRLIRVGNNPQNATAISALLEELLGKR